MRARPSVVKSTSISPGRRVSECANVVRLCDGRPSLRARAEPADDREPRAVGPLEHLQAVIVAGGIEERSRTVGARRGHRVLERLRLSVTGPREVLSARRAVRAEPGPTEPKIGSGSHRTTKGT